MPPRTRNQRNVKSDDDDDSTRHRQPQRSGAKRKKYDDDADEEEWGDLDEGKVERLLHDDDDEDGQDPESDHPEDEEEVDDKKAKKKSKKEDADGAQQEGSEEESPSRNYTGGAVEVDPMVHLVENVVADKKEHGQMRQYLIKYKGLSYHYSKWITEEEFSTQLSFQCQQKLKRYKIKKEKQSGTLVQNNLEEGQYFDKNFLEVDKILSCTNLFPVIHPHTSKKVNDTWRERLIDILQFLCNQRNDNHCLGTPFLYIRTDDSQLMDLTTINNRLFTISNPPPAATGPPGSKQNQQAQQAQVQSNQASYNIHSFWQDLGQVFKENMRLYCRGTKQRVYLEHMRELSYHLYNAWHQLIQIGEPFVPNNESQEKALLQEMITAVNKFKEANDKGKGDTSMAQQLFQLRAQVHVINQRMKELQTKIQATSSQKEPLDLSLMQDRNKLVSSVTLYIQNLEEKNFNDIIRLANLIHDSIKAQDPNILRLKQGEDCIKGMEKNYQWLLDQHEALEEVTFNHYYEYHDIYNKLLEIKTHIDPLYLCKWKNLSYLDASWEPLTKLKDQYDEKIKDFERFNRSLDAAQRQKMQGFSYANKQLIKIYEKKVQLGKKIDSKSNEESQTRELINKLLKTEAKAISSGYFQYDYEKNLVPQFRKSQTLKDYQISGLNWLIRAWQDNRNVVLADEMGLGKTIMTISFLDHMWKIWKIRGPFIVIAPLSTLDHWKRVAEEWTQMNVVVYHDQRGWDGRQEVQRWEWFFTDITNKGTLSQKSRLTKFNLMITSYEVFNQDLHEVLQEVPFLYVVVDEAHRLKNKQTKTLQLLKTHPCKKILLLTGTPIQNNTKELFSIMNYIEPDIFSSFDKFMADYGKLETVDQIEKLHSMLRPHFLRRMKDEVEFSIPPLKETVIEVGLTSIQQAYYKGIYGENLAVLAQLGTSSVKTSQLSNIDIQLRKCCNHLYLLKGVEEELTRDCKTDSDFLNKMLDTSGKLILLDKFIEKYRQENHKMLVFSQFKGMIDIIQMYLQIKGIRFELLTGSVKSSDRGVSISRFNEDNEFGVFLLTTRAGGLGINLTKARVVVIFDSDWNPQNDLQAIARAHRIGQQFEVSVYRFITSKTYEQQMFERASRKLGMEQALFQKGAFGDKDGGDISQEMKINPKEIENLLKYGAYAFLEDGSGENIANTHIEDILAKNTSKKEYKLSKGLYTLQKSQFNVPEHGRSSATKGSASKSHKPDVNDPNFWDKVLPFEGQNPKQLNRKFKSKKADILKNKETQSKFLKDVSKCVKDLLEAKAVNDSLPIDEEIFDLLKKISKTKQFENKYRDKAQVLLNKILHFNDFQNAIIRDEGGEEILNPNFANDPSLLGKRTLKRSAKENVDYKEKNGQAKKRDKKKEQSQESQQDESGSGGDDDEGRKRFGRLCKKNKNDEFEVEDQRESSQQEEIDEGSTSMNNVAPQAEVSPRKSEVEEALEQALRGSKGEKKTKKQQKGSQQDKKKQDNSPSTEGSTSNTKPEKKAKGEQARKPKVVMLQQKGSGQQNGCIDPNTTKMVISLNTSQLKESKKKSKGD